MGHRCWATATFDFHKLLAFGGSKRETISVAGQKLVFSLRVPQTQVL